MTTNPIAMNDMAAWIRDSICEYVSSGENSLYPGGPPEPAWMAPLVGFSSGDDPLYRLFKEDIGEFYWMPAEIFAATFPGAKASPGELTVISWILPQTERTRRESAREKTLPSERWARARKYGEDFNVKLRSHLAERLGAAGFDAVAPAISPLWRTEKSERYGFASSWSERHAAYAAGLGTFGLCDGLITARGKAMRCGSVVARVSVTPSPRPYDDHHAYCLFYVNGTCGKCAERCPADAISREGGHDKQKCREYAHTVGGKSIVERFGFEMHACGLCQVDVPCEARNPIPIQTGTEREESQP